MNKFIFKYKHIFGIVFLISIFSFFAVKLTGASDETMICDNGGCSSNNIQLFNELNVLPGDTYSKTIEVQSTRDKDVSLYLSASKQSITDDIFLDVIEVQTYFDSVIVSTKSLREFLDGTLITLGNLSDNQNKIIEISLYFDKNADNRYQNKFVVFDIFVNITGDDIVINGVDDNGGGETTLVTTTTDVLGNSSPLVLGVNNFVKDLEKIVGDLFDNQKINQPEVLGINCEDEYYRWWIPLFVQILLIVLLTYLGFKKNMKIWVFFLIETVFCILSQIVHELLGCNCATGIWCPRYIYLNFGVALLFLLIYWITSYIKKTNSLEDIPINN